MHDVNNADSTYALRRGLEAYLRAVAEAIDLPAEGTSCEISDTATAYVALPGRPGKDLMLLWDERAGWSLAIEHNPPGKAETVARLGTDVVPAPDDVAAFVENAVAGRSTSTDRPATASDRAALAERLSGYIAGPT